MIVKLSPRQAQIAEFLIRGVRSAEEMAPELGIEVQSISNVKRTLFQKCDVHSSKEFVAQVLRGVIKIEKKRPRKANNAIANRIANAVKHAYEQAGVPLE
jgi:DNA-binding CsgD family transcriptional regulator